MKQLSLMIIFLFALAILTHAQNERKFVRQGNKYYGAALKDTTKIDSTLFNKAEIEYRKALDKKPTDPKWNFNLSNSLYKQMKFEESAEKFKEISELATDKVEKSHALHNMGNSLLMNNKLDESIEAYKQALRNNPKDLETKYNLLYAMNLKKKQEEEQKKQDKNKDQDKDKDKDQNKDQDKKDQDQQKQDQQQQQQPQNKISKQNAEQMLQALETEEKKTQEKVKKVQALKAKSKQVEKDW